MPKSSNLNIRIEPEIKDKAEKILASLGLTSSAAINIFYNQIILNGGLPFEVQLPSRPAAKSFYEMSETEKTSEIQKGLDDINSGRAYPAVEAFKELRKKYDV